MSNKTVSVPVGAAEFAGKTGYLVHAAEVDENEQLVRVLCKRVKVEHLLDDASLFGEYEVTCPVCKKRMAQ